MSEITAKGAGMSAAYEALARASTDIEAELAELDRKVATLRGSWSGTASDAYDSAHRQWRGELDRIHALLTDYSRRLANIDARYRQASRGIAGSIWT